MSKRMGKGQAISRLGAMLKDVEAYQAETPYADDLTSVEAVLKGLYESHCEEEGVAWQDPTF